MRHFRQSGEWIPPRDIALDAVTRARFLDLSPDLRCVLDRDGNFLHASSTWTAATGYSVDDLCLQPLLYWVHPDDRDATRQALAAVLAGATTLALEHRVIAQDGRSRWLKWTLGLEAVTGRVLGVGLDITDRKVEADLHGMAIESAPIAMLVVDQQGAIVLVNRKFEQLFGYSRNEILGQMVESLLPMAARERHLSLRGTYHGAPEDRAMGAGRELFGLRKDGTSVQVEIQLSPIVTAGQQLVLCSMLDISGRKQHEAQLHAHVEELHRHREEMTLLSEMASLLQHAMTTQEAHDVALSFVGRLFPNRSVRIYAQAGNGNGMERVGAPSGRESDCLEANDCWALRRGQVHRSAADQPPMCQHVRSLTQWLHVCIPLSVHGQGQGLLTIGIPRESATDAQQGAVEALGRSVADHLAKALSSLDLRERLRQLSVRDPLTDLYNRRYLEEAVRSELARARRQRGELAVLMIDVDHFKRYNDTHGHVAGDAALKDLAAHLRRYSRQEDVVCRFGGEEFVIVLAGASLAQAELQAERLRSGCSTMGSVTLSIGVAGYPTHGAEWPELLAKADLALFEAKSAGRNRVCVAPDPGQTDTEMPSPDGATARAPAPGDTAEQE